MVTATAWAVAAGTPDPELPMLTVADLGILRDVEQEGDAVVVTITPTYSGCPAQREIAGDLRHRLRAAGFGPVEVRTRLAPPWTSDWITADGRRKLAEAGIAPPLAATRRSGPVPLTLPSGPPGGPSRRSRPSGPVPLTLPSGPPGGPTRRSRPSGPVPLTLPTAPPGGPDIACPQCGSRRTTRTAQFGATACKALYRCEACREPFEYVKEI
jgi:ring-1,2-phenylacetyl-CoA epoxidase subunit PaaD